MLEEFINDFLIGGIFFKLGAMGAILLVEFKNVYLGHSVYFLSNFRLGVNLFITFKLINIIVLC